MSKSIRFKNINQKNEDCPKCGSDFPSNIKTKHINYDGFNTNREYEHGFMFDELEIPCEWLLCSCINCGVVWEEHTLDSNNLNKARVGKLLKLYRKQLFVDEK